MYVFSEQKGAIGVGRSAFKFLPPSLPAGWWVWGWEASATRPILVESNLKGAMSNCCCCTSAAKNSPTVPLRRFSSSENDRLWETVMDFKDQRKKKDNKMKKRRTGNINSLWAEWKLDTKEEADCGRPCSHRDFLAGLGNVGHPVGQPEEPRRAISPGLNAQMAFFRNWGGRRYILVPS